MRGRKDGSKVWFDPIGIRADPGVVIRWTNRDPGNAHTATAYHPNIGVRQRRIPEAALPWDSGYLLPGDSYSTTLTVAGVYDYYCLPHEHAGMVGRIVVGDPAGFMAETPDGHEPPPDIALARFPPFAEIALHGMVRVE
jgi:plastocyanin